MKAPITHADAEKKSRRLETKQLAKVLKKLERDHTNFLVSMIREDKKATAALAKMRKRHAAAKKRAIRNTDREKATILRRLAIINGRGI